MGEQSLDSFDPGDISTKQRAYALYETGFFGNKLLTWKTPEELIASGYQGLISMRYKGKSGGGHYQYRVKIDDIPKVIDEWVAKGADRNLIVYNESAPDDDLILQGEVTRTVRGLEFFYSPAKKKMREVMGMLPIPVGESRKPVDEKGNIDERPIQISGLRAKLFLETTLTPSSMSDLDSILDMFPDHAVEISVYAYPVGNIPGRNTIFWEVRKY